MTNLFTYPVLISETNINVTAAVKPNFAIASKIDKGPPFTKTISENTKSLPNRSRAIERGEGIPSGSLSLPYQ